MWAQNQNKTQTTIVAAEKFLQATDIFGYQIYKLNIPEWRSCMGVLEIFRAQRCRREKR